MAEKKGKTFLDTFVVVVLVLASIPPLLYTLLPRSYLLPINLPTLSPILS